MADTILLRGGKKANMPTLREREIVVATDEKAVYIGIGGANVRVCGADDKTELDRKLTATQMASLTALPTDSNISAVVNAYNSLLSALKSSGIMK